MGALRFFVPGRIEVLGKHTDYAGGRSLLAAVDRGFTVEVTATDDLTIIVHDRARQETVTLPLPEGTERDGDRLSADPDKGPGWSVYPRTVVQRVHRDFPGRLGGCRIELASDIPAASGMSSSSALITALFLALDAACGISGSGPYRDAIGGPPLADDASSADHEALAGYLGAVERGSPYPGLGGEHNGVGTRGGSEDHVAILCAEPDRLVRYTFEPVRREGDVAMPAGHTFAVGVSGARADKTGSAQNRYNLLSDTAARAAELWRTATDDDAPHLAAVARRPDGIERLRAIIADHARPDERAPLEARVRHFVTESDELVPRAAEALAVGDIARFGRLVDRSQALAEELLGNQVPETVHLARSAREIGAAAASAFGAGFGGSVWALIEIRSADDFLDAWRTDYHDAFPGRVEHSTFFATPAAPAARRL